jgi:hypothetical protein
MCEHRLRNHSAGTIGHGTALPGFLLVLVALANSMRLSLMKAAHVALSSAARQEIRVWRRRICLRRRWPCTSHENTLPRKTGVEILNLSLQLGSCHSKEVRRGRQICGEGLRFDGENVHHPNPAIWCTGTETNFRVKVAGHESNCKILAELFKGVG